ncbi:MAG: antitoxin VapB family protein [Candidatus Nanoarchaeia archaeon]|nr:antitoxin VapB family protein [Candidatus Nanoarchaeia archaeon]
MAKTIMVSNEVYGELKARKAKRSFSETITDLINSKKDKIGSNLRSCLGLLKKDKEFYEIEKALNKGWKEWNKKYA